MFRFPVHWRGVVCLLVLVVCSVSFAADASYPQLRIGFRGPEAVLVQHYLARLGYLTSRVDGIFGAETESAVKKFQNDHGIKADGIVGSETWDLLRREVAGLRETITVRPGDTLWDLAHKYRVSVSELARINDLKDPGKLKVGQQLLLPVSGAKNVSTSSGMSARKPPELLLWSEADEVFAKGMTAEIVDVESGLTFRVKRCYGHYHADVEPLTRQDTEAVKRLYGGKFSWNRRAVIVVVGGRSIAASMNGFPHGNATITDNGFPGHFCIHFLGSRLHLDGTIHRSHQEMVLRAAGYPSSPLWFTGDRTR